MNPARNITNQSNNVSNSVSLSTPTRRRRSRISSLNLDASYTIPLNDDEFERAAIRRQTFHSLQTTSYVTEASACLSPKLSNEIIQMLPAQVQSGIAQYVKMNFQNKINKDNAFDLNIIDFMSCMVRKQNHEMESFLVAISALDVSAKVYSLRVDSLYDEVFKISNDLCRQERIITQEDTNGNNNDNNPDEQRVNVEPQNKSKKRKKSHLRVKTIKALQGAVDTVSLEALTIFNSDNQTSDMLFQATMPQHCIQELQLNMFNDIIYDNCNDVIDDSENLFKIKWPIVEVDNRLVIDPEFSEFQFLSWSLYPDVNDLSPVSPVIYTNEPGENLMFDDHFVFDLDASIPNEENNFQSNASYDEAMDVDEYEIRTENVPANRPFENIVDVRRNSNGLIDVMSCGELEYSFYLDPVNVIRNGPNSWKVKFLKRRQDDNREDGGVGPLPTKRRRKEINLIFDDDNINMASEKLSAKIRGNIRHCTWTEKKNTLSNQFSQCFVADMKKLYFRPDDVIEFPIKQPINGNIISERIDRLDNEDNIGDNNNSINLNTGDVQLFSDNYTFEPEFNNEIERNVSAQFIYDNLIEMPKITSFVRIPGILRAKRINIRKLKAIMLSKLQVIYNDFNKNNNHVEDDIEENSLRNNVYINNVPIEFSQLYIELPALLSTQEAKELSFAIAYTALLQLANEKNLLLSHAESFSDINIFFTANFNE
ncbi:hypothetical protein PV327_006747 [Microctonus hyperodae]|uniref:Condensin complex subunit 2 n=1 Tax=Microctonus hyperodae TaxID=165561 RepID=A0AA39F4X7_MICHY|nr:hypothetical protein PV327_006747 [Microctonus hyperodae]